MTAHRPSGECCVSVDDRENQNDEIFASDGAVEPSPRRHRNRRQRRVASPSSSSSLTYFFFFLWLSQLAMTTRARRWSRGALSVFATPKLKVGWISTGATVSTTTTTTTCRAFGTRRGTSTKARSRVTTTTMMGSGGGGGSSKGGDANLPGWDPKKSNNDGGKKEGYRFGDFTKGLVGGVIGGSVSKMTGKAYQFGDLSKTIDNSIKDRINDVTGKDEYRFGDLSRAADSSIKNRIGELTGKNDYEFGDLSRYVDGKVKRSVTNMTGNEEYRFGDLTKEIVRRVASGQYTLDDLFLLFKVIAMFEASICPVAGFLPVKLLVELLNFSIAGDVTGRVASGLAMELDRRLKKSILGNEDYTLGDATKSAVSGAVAAYTGKEAYSFGDVTKKVVSEFAGDAKVLPGTTAAAGGRKLLGATPAVVEALDRWDVSSEDKRKDSLALLETYVDQAEKDGGVSKPSRG